MTTLIREGMYLDTCRARGCGGYLRGVGTTVGDGETAYCAVCRRMHTFVIFGDGDDTSVGVRVERKPRGKR